jgi:hypothetical protein
MMLAMLAWMSAVSFAGEPGPEAGGEWVGQMLTKGQTAATAPTSKVTLRAMGSRLSGTWGSYALAGSIEEGHVELTLTDTSGAMVAQMRGRVGDDAFYGNGSMQPAQGAGEWTAMSWTLTRAAIR